MSAAKLKNIKSSMEETGFVQEDERVFRWNKDANRTVQRSQLPWHIMDWKIDVEGQKVRQQSFMAKLDKAILLANIEELLRAKFPAFRAVAIEDDKQTGFWLLIEFLDRDLDADQSRLIEDEDKRGDQLPHGLAGLHLNPIEVLGQFTVFMTKHFFIGNTPGQIFVELPKIFNAALFGSALKDKSSFNSYVCILENEELRKELMKGVDFPDELYELVRAEEKSGNLPFRHTRFHGSTTLGWNLEWSQADELPDLVVPPIEILEQKEVSRRFQKLDELILLEDYPAAVEQCRVYLERHSHSLYLVRRWAFLTLWSGLPFEQKYLDLMTKYDPSNLLTISLWIRRGLSSTEGAVLLENLSKLGNTLGNSVRDFENNDITSLTLPEMLGDAWNSKDDQRAVACYERVLRARGEIPRILVKLIRLMRDIDDPTSEESYMDRLLICEVPTRTRAAIYYRLAEIKQGSDLREASSWSLKSWQTNRSQVRYALLAADLLIALERPQDAVHILVETSAILPENEPVESRLQLELRIASVWHENMQRLDLASERIERARELAGEDLAYNDQILNVVEKMNEPELLADIIEHGMQAALKSGDAFRKAKFVQTLVDIAEAINDANRASRIFTFILTNTLLNPAYTLSIFNREGLKIPYETISAAIQEMLANLDAREQGPYYQLLGDLSQGRDNSKTLAFYEKAAEQDALSQSSFDYLDEYYAKSGMNTQRYSLLQKKFRLASESEKGLILRELYYFDEGVTNEERDSYALQIFVSDADDIGPLEERVAAYEHGGDGASIIHLVDKAVQMAPANPGLNSLVRHALDITDAISHADKYSWAMQLINKLRDLNEDSIELARLTVTYLWNATDKSLVKGPLEILISRAEIPTLPPGEMLDLIEDDNLKIDLLLQLADRNSDFEGALAYEREALRLAKGMTGMLGIKLEILHRLSSKIEFSLAEINDFIKDVKTAGKDQFAVRFLAHQLRLQTRGDVKERILEILPDFLQSAALNDEDRELMQEVIQALPAHQGMPPRLFWLERFGFNKTLHDAAFARSVLVDRSNWTSRDAILTIVRNLLKDPGNANSVRESVNDFIKNLISDKRDELLRTYLEDNNISSQLDKGTLRALMSHFALQQDDSTFQNFWRQLLLRMEKRDETAEFLDYSRRTFADRNMSEGLLDRLNQIIDTPAMYSALSPEVIAEIRFTIADMLIDLGRDARKALSIFEGLYVQNKNDTRLWGVLITMYKELGHDSDLYELLHHTLPALRQDPKPLRSYQLSVSSLQLEFAEIGQRLGLVEFSPNRGANAASPAPSPAPASEAKEFPIVPLKKDRTNVPSFAEELAVIQSGRNDDDDDDGDGGVFSKNTPTAQSDGKEKAAEADISSFRGTFPLHTKVAALPDLTGPATPRYMDESLPPEALKHETVSAALPQDEDIEPVERTAPNPFLDPGLDTNSRRTPLEPDPSIRTSAGVGFPADAWRKASRSFQTMEGLTAALVKNPLPEPLEQLMAVQVAALLENKAGLLNQAKSQIWRKPEDMSFELRWTDRMTREMFHPNIKSPLARLLKTLYPIFMQQFAAAMSLTGVAERLRVRPDEITKARKALDWQDEVIQRGGLRYYARFLTDNGYHLYNLPAVEDHFQFDFEKRDIYIDRNYFMTSPSTHLFHRLTFLIRAMSLDYYPYLHLNPSNDIFPFLMKCRRSIEESQSENFKRVLGMDKDPLKVMLTQAKDRDYLDQLFREVGTVTPDKINSIVSTFIDQIYRLNLAETLDLVGMVETIANVDLTSASTSSLQVLNENAAAKIVLMFAADLRFKK